jgi:CBS domain containing-hemolysin-like protein
VSPVVALALVMVLIAANGFFVAAEFALVAVRRSSLEAAAAAGDKRATIALKELERLSFVLSACQFGITATSLVVGFLAEEAFGRTVVDPVLRLLGFGEANTVAVSVTVAFLLSTFLQMLFGELAPKNLAIAEAEATSLRVARLIRLFGIVMGPLIRIFDGSAEWVSRRVFRLEVQHERLGGHSPEELARIISVSREEGSLNEVQGELLTRAVVLGDRRVHEVMVPRPDVTFLSADATCEDLRRMSRETGHSRFPVRGATDDDIVGTVHIKDLLAVPADERATTPIARLVSEPLIVPETDRLRRLVGKLRGTRRTFAVVVDEYGGTAGIVTLEDVLEELVGEIEDEFDRPVVGSVRRIGAGRFLVRGGLRLDDVEGATGLLLPPGEYETVAGFVIERLGRIPAEQESIVYDGWTLEVTRVEGVRVAEVTIRRPPGGHAREGER